jgi:hypothetical protein
MLVVEKECKHVELEVLAPVTMSIYHVELEFLAPVAMSNYLLGCDAEYCNISSDVSK